MNIREKKINPWCNGVIGF